jgi:hypothetical protein
MDSMIQESRIQKRVVTEISVQPILTKRGTKSKTFRDLMAVAIKNKNNNPNFRVGCLRAFMKITEDTSSRINQEEISAFQTTLNNLINDRTESRLLRIKSIRMLASFRNEINYSFLQDVIQTEKDEDIKNNAIRSLGIYLSDENDPIIKRKVFFFLKYSLGGNNAGFANVNEYLYAISSVKEEYAKEYLLSLFDRTDLIKKKEILIYALKRYADRITYKKCLDAAIGNESINPELTDKMEYAFLAIAKDDQKELYSLFDEKDANKIALLKGVRLLGQRNKKDMIREKVIDLLKEGNTDEKIASLETLPYLFETPVSLKDRLVKLFPLETDVKVKKEYLKYINVFY